MGNETEDIKFVEGENYSDEDVPDEAHNKLLNAVSQLYKKQRIAAPKRREPAQEISEFSLSSNLEKNSSKVRVADLLKDLKQKVTHKEINAKVKAAQKKANTLPKPLEKNEADKITRQVGYENVKKKLDKWNTIVERNKLADQLTFPLAEQSKISMESGKPLREPTELEKAAAAVLNRSEVAQEEKIVEESLSSLSIEEMVLRRQMVAKMRARESYRIAKAVRQNKIKSKRYHRILKKEKIKQELKDFEKLQKTDPEAALAKLEQIERARAEERISLRHRNTGKWARSKAIRAKYDTEARKELAEQLAKSRDLTRKVNIDKSSSDEEMAEENSEEERTVPNVTSTSDLSNPWAKGTVVDKFLSGYEKFSSRTCNEHSNDNTSLPVQSNIGSSGVQVQDPVVSGSHSKTKNKSLEDTVGETNRATPESYSKEEEMQTEIRNGEYSRSCSKKDHSNIINEKYSENFSNEENQANPIVIDDDGEILSSDDSIISTDKEIGKRKKMKRSISRKSPNDSDVLDKLDDLSDRIKRIKPPEITSIEMDFKESRRMVRHLDSTNRESSEPKIFKQSKGIDEALIEIHNDGISSGINDIKNIKDKLSSSENLNTKEPHIDPNKHVNVQPQRLISEIGALEEAGNDSDEENTHKMDLMEAFADDDIADQFRKEKDEESKKNKAEEINLEMPGWGSWGGTNIKTKKKLTRKKRRFIVRMPKVPRKDEKKEHVIINEDPVPALRDQLVSELPYPFTSVKEYEASIRAPLGKNWVPERAHRKLIAPPVVTKMGTIIEPMSDPTSVPQIKRRRRLK